MDQTQKSGFQILQGINLPPDSLDDPICFINLVRDGISGEVLLQATDSIGHHELFGCTLGIQPIHLSRLYQLKHLSKHQSEIVLDLLRLFRDLIQTFDSLDTARDWLLSRLAALGNRRPRDICDTFSGRSLVRSILRKIESGDFS